MEDAGTPAVMPTAGATRIRAAELRKGGGLKFGGRDLGAPDADEVDV